MNETEQPRISRKLMIGVILYAILLLAIVLISNLHALNVWFAKLSGILRPILVGLAIAYLSNPIFRFLERKLLLHISKPRLRRALALLMTYLFLVLIITGLLSLIIPQLIISIQNFVANFDTSLASALTQINDIISRINSGLPPREDGSPVIPPLDMVNIQNSAQTIWNNIQEQIKEHFRLENLKPENFGFIKDIFGQTTTVLKDLIFGIFVSLYLLASKERRYAQIMKFRKAYLDPSTNTILSRIVTTADRSFGNFLRGKILDSAIVAVLVYLTCLIFRIPYAVLVAAVVGITDVIPVIGPFIGVIPTAIIILLTDPIKALIFVIAILVIQQIDGNIIAPKILGENTGVSSLCVMIAIIVMGGLWGLMGMLLGVPLFATVIELSKIYINKRLEEKGLPTNIENYSPSEHLPAKNLSEQPAAEPVPVFPLSSGTTTGNLTELEQVQLRTYALARKFRVFDHLSDTVLNDFAFEAEKILSMEMQTPAAESSDVSLPDHIPESAPENHTEGD